MTVPIFKTKLQFRNRIVCSLQPDFTTNLGGGIIKKCSPTCNLLQRSTHSNAVSIVYCYGAMQDVTLYIKCTVSARSYVLTAILQKICFPGCDAVSLTEWLPTFKRFMMPSSSRVKESPRPLKIKAS